ncbi:hypothetical protein ACIHCQ_23650 [Streptomyces sp. NPDC052236]|uniref:hypothetical protein n=1 Tax=Streptomyces sp. NPDC052236 TaxID=3365686 RepID=UPI0037CE7B39
MAGEFSAFPDGIRGSSREIGEASRQGDAIGPRFETDSEKYDDCWGEEGGDDLFANQVIPQVREERAQVMQTLDAITSGFRALVDAVEAEADNVQRPQDLALEDIQAYGGEIETRR